MRTSSGIGNCVGLRNSAEDGFVHFLVEPDDKFLPDPKSRRPKVAGWSKRDGKHVVQRRRIFLDVEFNNFFAPCREKMRTAFNQPGGLITPVSLFFGINKCRGLNFLLRKKLLRFCAALSSLAMIVPVNFGHE